MAEERKIVKCKGCGADIFFEQGVPWFAKKVPVLRQQPVSVHHQEGAKLEFINVKESAYVSHFINCPKASQFSGSKVPLKAARIITGGAKNA